MKWLTLALTMLVGLVIPAQAQQQDIRVEREIIKLNLSPGGEFGPGQGIMSTELINQLEAVNFDREFDFLVVIGKYDEMTWNDSTCDRVIEPRTVPDRSTREELCDAYIAEVRAERVAQWILDRNWGINPYTVKTRSLFDEDERSVELMFVNFVGHDGRLDTSELEDRLDGLWEAIQSKAAKDRAQDREISSLDDRVTTLENRDFSGGVNVDPHIGVGYEYFADQLTPTVQVGMQLGEIDFTGWYGYRPEAGTAEIHTGTVDTRRISYGGSFTWYIFGDRNIQIGPSVGFEHAEEVIEDRQEYTVGHESFLVGLTGDLRLLGHIGLNVSAAYAPIKSYESTNLELHDETDSPLRMSAVLRIKF